ncbi:DUF1499 domain-containing protein [Persicimonas caeni]|uniref:DUF1499 domain-containing protein n=1 Tax=Persicimonas caeni TaxID=2292766 RepID=A0A4Y6PYL3_PERCE|nr:DUF1499 domain-containing protein [Persicimonas caeni]QDG53320.1 DUF1499 domain-containing protein [Persicimonas caeni]QED34542.1 DUF1499 domain-containing protein [Persicimonas caeni]
MKQKLLIALAVLVGVTVTGLLVAASIWPVINEVETGKTPEYPEVQPQYYTTDPQRVFEEAKAGVEELDGWTLVGEDAATYTLEAERETDVFGFIDDVTIRVEPVTEFVTRVNVRSASRVGKGDFGQNARNIEEFFVELDGRLGAVKFDPEKLRQKQNEAEEASEDSADSDDDGS